MEQGEFSIQEPDIAKLELPERNRRGDASRRGWINVGAFALCIETDHKGNLAVEVYPCGNEEPVLAKVQVLRESAMRRGATDIDKE